MSSFRHSRTLRRHARRIGAVLAAALSAVAFTACTPASRSAAGGTLDVAASVSQWGTMARALGGEHVVVTSAIANAAADPHDYEPTTADIAGISSADIAVVNGAGYDTGRPRRPGPPASTRSTSARWRGSRKAATRTCGSPRKPERPPLMRSPTPTSPPTPNTWTTTGG